MTDCVVIKIGGSLFRGTSTETKRTLTRLKAWLDELSYPTQLMIAGGGEAVGLLRGQFAQGAIDSESAHWQAIRLMDENTQRLAKRHDVPSIDTCQAGAGRACLLVSSFLRQDDAQPDHLPHSWDVTSDSIAAQISLRCNADLILLKSCAIPSSNSKYDWPALARTGVVDVHFPHIAPRVRSVILANLPRGIANPRFLTKANQA
jgi:aspartokinase-like uncharacterized kinase